MTSTTLEQSVDNSELIDNISVDCVVLGFEQDELKVLLYERGMENEPGYNDWALPGGFVKKSEDLDDAASRSCLLYTYEAADE